LEQFVAEQIVFFICVMVGISEIGDGRRAFFVEAVSVVHSLWLDWFLVAVWRLNMYLC